MERVGRHSMIISGSPNSTGWPSSIRIWITRARARGGDLVHGLHRLDDQQRLARAHPAADLDEGPRAGLGPAIGGADHGRGDDARMLGRDRRRRSAARRRGWRWRAARGCGAGDGLAPGARRARARRRARTRSRSGRSRPGAWRARGSGRDRSRAWASPSASRPRSSLSGSRAMAQPLRLPSIAASPSIASA